MDQDIFIVKLCSQDFNLSSEDTQLHLLYMHTQLLPGIPG